MKYASVCSGVEAASLAWMPLGWEAAWFSEIEPFPCAVLNERFPNVPNLGDMTKIKVENLENGDQRFTNGSGADVVVQGGVDLLVGGTPCQGFSVAGKQGGLEDDRSVLCLTFCQLLADMRPRWFVWENVPGVFSTAGGEDFKAFIRKIDEVGYHVAWRVLDAQYVRVDGYPRAVPQRRRRVFVVGYLDGWEYPAEVLFEPHSLFGNTPPRRVKGKGFTADVERSVGTAGRPWDESGVNPTLNQANAGGGTIGASNQELFAQNFNGLVLDSYSVDRRNQILTEDDAVPCDVCGMKPDVYGRLGEEYTVACDHCIAKDTITAASEHEAVRLWNERNTRSGSAVAIAENIIGRQVQNGGNGTGAQEELAYTQNTSGVMGVANHATVRRLLPIECERLMGFPDNWTRIPWKRKSAEECPDSPRYKACGNSMCVNVMRWIGMRIEMVERKVKWHV